MRPIIKKSASVAVCLLLLLLLTAVGAGAAARTGKVAPAQYEPEAPATGGSLQIRFQSDEGAQYPPGDLVLSDPEARLTGYDSRADYTYQEIPGATYSSETISSRQQAFRLYVANAQTGVYGLRVIGVDYGKYLLIMDGYDQEGNHARVRFTFLLQPGEVHHYLIQYSTRGGVSIKARRTRTTE